MQGYGKEVYKSISNDESKKIINGKEYNIYKNSYYDDETGDNDYKILVTDNKGKEVYSYRKEDVINNNAEYCSQNIFVVDENFLKELNKISDIELPTEKEVVAKELERKLKYGNDSLQMHPLSNLFKEKKIEFNESYESLEKEAIGNVIKEHTTEVYNKDEYVDFISKYMKDKINYFY